MIASDDEIKIGSDIYTVLVSESTNTSGIPIHWVTAGKVLLIDAETNSPVVRTSHGSLLSWRRADCFGSAKDAWFEVSRRLRAVANKILIAANGIEIKYGS